LIFLIFRNFFPLVFWWLGFRMCASSLVICDNVLSRLFPFVHLSQYFNPHPKSMSDITYLLAWFAHFSS
jgi:hypothetical protein